MKEHSALSRHSQFTDDAAKLIENGWRQKRILIAGDLMLDKYIFGEVERISPEAPVPVVLAGHSSEQPGGAANVAMNVAGLGARVTVAGFAGADDDGARLRQLLVHAGIKPILIEAPGFPTVSKLRILGGRQQMLRLDTERRGAPSPEAHGELLKSVLEEVEESDAVILSDYAKGVLTEHVCQTIIHACRSRNLPVLVDPKNSDLARYRGATTISPNLHEMAAALQSDGRDLDLLFEKAQAMLPSLGLDYLTITLGAKGIAVLRPGDVQIAPAVARQVFDVSGAGDTVIAVLALAAASGVSVETAVHLANVAAGVVVSKVGTVPISLGELSAALSAEAVTPAKNKVFTLQALLAQVAAWRASGEEIAFTNGCFDLLHTGHVALLEQSRRSADRLIVGVNSDQSVARLKGPTRPVVQENNRAQVLAALAAVDAVALFEEDTPLRLIEQIRPDVLVKGGDYSEATIVGAPEVRRWGGRVLIIPTIAGSSTTNLIERSRK